MKYFRFLLVMTIAFGLLVAPVGCASVKSFFTSAQTVTCNPPPAVIAVVKAAAPLIKLAVELAVPGSEIWLAGVDAASAIDSIQNGICISVTQLNNLIAFLQSKGITMAQYKVSKKTMKAVPASINIQPLVIWANSLK